VGYIRAEFFSRELRAKTDSSVSAISVGLAGLEIVVVVAGNTDRFLADISVGAIVGACAVSTFNDIVKCGTVFRITVRLEIACIGIV
jgi:hypothetical protein